MTSPRDILTAILREEPIDWSAFSFAPRQLDLEEEAVSEGVECLIGHHLKRVAGVPQQLCADFELLEREHALRDRLSQLEWTEILDSLNVAGIPAVLMKGTPLAYSHYLRPWLRPRWDLDLLVRQSDLQRASERLLDRGYLPLTELPGFTLQKEVTLLRVENPTHYEVDLHWKTSGRTVFSQALGFEEILSRAHSVSALGIHASAPCAVHSLLIACMHRVSHRNSERLIWLYDIHLIVERLTEEEAREFVDLARERRVWLVCAESIRIAASTFHTPLPPLVEAELETPVSLARTEPSAAYLSGRWWRVRLTDLRALPGWRQRWSGFRELLFPRAAYLLELYGGRHRALLPFLYLDWLARRAVRVFHVALPRT